jgi:hypothetical protein
MITKPATYFCEICGKSSTDKAEIEACESSGRPSGATIDPPIIFRKNPNPSMIPLGASYDGSEHSLVINQKVMGHDVISQVASFDRATPWDRDVENTSYSIHDIHEGMMHPVDMFSIPFWKAWNATRSTMPDRRRSIYVFNDDREFVNYQMEMCALEHRRLVDANQQIDLGLLKNPYFLIMGFVNQLSMQVLDQVVSTLKPNRLIVNPVYGQARDDLGGMRKVLATLLADTRG